MIEKNLYKAIQKFFTYYTTRAAMIKSTHVGIVYRFLQFTILFYVI